MIVVGPAGVGPNHSCTPREMPKKLLFKIGRVEIVIGSLSVILCVITLIIAGMNPGYESTWRGGQSRIIPLRYDFTWSSQGIWCGAILIITGVYGVKDKSNRSLGLFKSNVALGIVAYIVMMCLMGLSVIAAISSYRYTHFVSADLLTLHILIAVLGLVSTVISMTHFVVSVQGWKFIRQESSEPEINLPQQRQ